MLSLLSSAWADPAALAQSTETLAADPIAERASLLLPSLGAQIEEKLQRQLEGPLSFVPVSLQAWQLAPEGAHFRVLGELRPSAEAPRQIEVHGLIARDDLALGALRIVDASTLDVLALPETEAAAAAEPNESPASEWLQQNAVGWLAQPDLANANPQPWR